LACHWVFGLFSQEANAALAVLCLARMNANSMLKRLWIGSAGMALLTLCSTAQADPPKQDQLPPGLAKKDKLPPGWQKKVAKKEQGGTNVTVAPAASTPPRPNARSHPNDSRGCQ
jgi:hypothetical protein